jgi:hypothetical protein
MQKTYYVDKVHGSLPSKGPQSKNLLQSVFQGGWEMTEGGRERHWSMRLDDEYALEDLSVT